MATLPESERESEMNLSDKLDALRSAGFQVRYADPAAVYSTGYVSGSSLWSEYPRDTSERPFVDFGIRGEDMAGQSGTVDRSNFRSLERDFGATFVRVSYSNVDTLGGFPHSMSDEAIGIVIGLREVYPVYDDSDLSELESEETFESWGQYLWFDTYRSLPEEWQDVADMFAGAKPLDGDPEIRDAFFAACHADDYYPEHDGLDVLWDDARVEELVIMALCALVAKYFGPAPNQPVLFAA
jgi:hypothetical protein